MKKSLLLPIKKFMLCALAIGTLGSGQAQLPTVDPIEHSLVAQLEEAQMQQLDMWSHLRNKIFGGKRKDDDKDRRHDRHHRDHYSDRDHRNGPHHPPPPPHHPPKHK